MNKASILLISLGLVKWLNREEISWNEQREFVILV